jgi:VWFA-related protein
MRHLLIVFVCLCNAARLFAQTPASDPVQGPTFRTGVDLIAIDVAVVDNRGRPIEDLHAADFTVKIDGEQRRVVSAELVKYDVESAKKQVNDKTETYFTSNLTAPQGRQIILAIDQMNVRPGSIRAVMSAAEKFLDKLSPLDQIAFVAYPEPGPRVGFTTDRLKLKLAMQSLIGHGVRSDPTRFNMGVAEAIRISDKRDQVTLSTVTTRECRRFGGVGSMEQCQREIIDEASQVAHRARQDADQSLRGLQQMLEQLALVDGPKSLILLSEGLAVDSLNELDEAVRLAAIARVAMNVLLLDGERGDVTVAQESPTPFDDRQIQMTGLQNLATMARGALYHVAGTGETIFDRLASEISAYYLLGVEQKANDREGARRRIDVQVGRRAAIIRSRQAFVLSAATRKRRSTEENLREALSSPFPISGVPLRATTFAQQDPGGSKVRLMIVADVGQAGAMPAPFGVGYLLIDREGKVAGSFGEKRTLSPVSGSSSAPLEFVGGVVVEPGIYELRLAVVDEEGRRGSVVREVNAWKMAGEELALGDLFVGNMPTAAGQGLRAAVEPHVTTDNLAAYVELYSTSAATFERANVTIEVADDPDGPALTSAGAQLAAGTQPAWRVAQGMVVASMLPPGRYVARARVVRNGATVSILTRPFILERTATSITPRAITFAPLISKFDRDAVLRRDFVEPMLAVVEKRSPTLKSALTEARAGRYGPAALEALSAGDQVVAQLLRGIELYAKGQLNEAATQLQLAAGPRREFFPAAFYLGACFAAAGRDRDAAGVWQYAIGSEPRPNEIYTLAADARMRDGQPGSAVDILKVAYERTPADDQIVRRLAMAHFVMARHADALPLFDIYLQRQPTDEEALFAAVLAQYEVVRAGQTLSNVDRAKIRRYASAYRGSERALVDKYLEVMQAR